MLYRSLTERDITAFLRLERYAFQVSPPRASLDGARMEHFRGLLEDGNLAAQLEILPLRVQTGLAVIAAAGIGSIASSPETRRRGYVESLLRHAADELRSSGVALCLLYPFKRSFYGRYGWATCFERRLYRGPPELFGHFRPGAAPPGQLFPDGIEQIEELDRIYRGALRGRFGPLVRSADWWDRHVLHDGERRPWHAYIWRDEQGAGRSYAIFRLDQDGEHRRFEAREMVALDPLARAQLFVLVAGYQDQVASVRFRAPADAPVNLLFPDPLECVVQPHFMLRLLDIPAALEGYGFPKSVAGTLTVAVADDWIAENCGTYALELADGGCRVSRLPEGAPADLRCDVRVLTQIYSRYLRPRTAAAFGLLEAPSREGLALAERAFAGLAPFGSDLF